MIYLLDTDICIYIINNRPANVRAIFEGRPASQSAISVISLLELQAGACKSAAPASNLALIEQFASPMTHLVFGLEDAESAARLRSSPELRARPIGPYDLLIAAQALSRSLTLVTNNEREFRRIKGLRVENWALKATR